MECRFLRRHVRDSSITRETCHEATSLVLLYLLDIVVGESATIFELLTSEDQSLLVRWDTLFVLNLALDIVDGVGRFDLKGDGLAREGLDEAGEIGQYR